MYKIYGILVVLIISSFQVSYAASVLESESNDTFATPQTIASVSFTTATNPDLQDDSLPTASIQGDIDIEGENVNDVDFYCFNAVAGSSLYLDIDYGENDDAPEAVSVDTELSLFDASGTLIAFDDDTNETVGGGGSVDSHDSFIGDYVIPAAGMYCAAVSSYDNEPTEWGGATRVALSLGGDSLTDVTPGVSTFIDDGGSTGNYILHISTNVVPDSYSVGGTVSGLAAGNSVVLRNNGVDDLTVGADGGYTFATSLANGSSYSVTVLTQPTTPSQTCDVSPNNIGTIDGADVTDVDITCVTDSFTVGGTVTGLNGSGLVLQNKNGDDLAINSDGDFIFDTALLDESDYAVTVLTQPTSLSQTCSVTKGSGNLAGANVSDVTVTCVTNTFSVGGTVSGLAAGNSVVLQNNLGDDLTVNANGNFIFGTALTDGSAYLVAVKTQPTTPNQSCSVVSSSSGSLSGADVLNVTVVCVTNTYTVGGTVSGLAVGNNVVLRLSTGDDLSVNSNGGFTFPTQFLSGDNYNVTVLTDPTSPNQRCMLSNSSGMIQNADVTDVLVSCSTQSYTVGGTVSGLAAGNSVVLQNNSGDDLTVEADGSFTFTTALLDESAYVVTVLTQPTTPNQVCNVTSGSGSLSGANVTNVTITCSTNTYTVGGTISGLAAGNSVVLQNNTGDDLTVNTNGNFTFATALADGSTYAVTVKTQPTAPDQSCSVISNGSGSLSGANITNVSITCVTNIPDISVVASTAVALEEGTVDGVFTISRTGSTALPLTVTFILGGTATEGTDYNPIGTSVVIPAGASSITVIVTPIDDSEQEPDETVTLTLDDNEASGSQQAKSVNRAVGPPATVTIVSNDNAQTIPTLQEWALILLSFLLLVVSRSYSRRH